MSARQSQAMSKSAGSNINEAFRSLRSTVKFASGEQPIRSVLVVDIDRDTRSSVAEQLATAFAETLKRLIDSSGVAIVSSAPLPRYADALAIAPRVDAVMLVVTSGGTRR